MSSSQTSFFTRLSSWFKGPNQSDLPLENAPEIPHPEEQNKTVTVTTFLRPWARRDAATSQLQEGFQNLNDLLVGVRESLDKQGKRQDELIRVLQHLPELLQAIPEHSKVQTQTLLALTNQLKDHNAYTHKLSQLLERVSDSSIDQKRILDALNDRVEVMARHDRSLADGMRDMSTAMENVSQNTRTSAQVLGRLHDGAKARDGELAANLHRQQVRMTGMLCVAIFTSIAALASVIVIALRIK